MKEIRENFAENLYIRIEQSHNGEPNELPWEALEDMLVKTAKEVCGVTKNRPVHKEKWWWCAQIKTAIDKKRQKFKEWQKASETDKATKHLEYREAKKEAKKCVALVQAQIYKEHEERLDQKDQRQSIFLNSQAEKSRAAGR